MKSMLQSPSMRSSFARLKNIWAANDAGIQWMLRNSGVVAVDTVLGTPGAPRDLLLVPSEQLLLLAVPLPLPTQRKRIEALPFAIEDRIVDRPETMHLALGTAVGDGVHLACVVDPARIAEWIMAAEEAGIPDAAIVPDALALPIPAAGRWTVYRDGPDRCLARTPDGAGFATATAAFPALWAVAGKPPCDEVDQLDAGAIALDLRQGAFARPRQGISSAARRAAIVAAAGLLAHGAIAAADTVALRSIAAKRGAEMTSLLAQVAPGAYGGTDPQEAAAIAADRLPTGQVAVPGRMMPLLVRASQAIAPFGATVAVRAIRYDDADASLAFDLDAADPEAARGLASAVRNAGLAARLDGSTLIVRQGTAR
jgi:general secretion pathway protein L